MTSVRFGRIFPVISILIVTVSNIGTGKLVRRHGICDKLRQDQSFNMKGVLYKPWRIQHAWNAPGNKCGELRFREPNHVLTTRVYQESASLLDRHPNWMAPQLLVTISGSPMDILLLFADGTQNSGKFDGIRHERHINVPVPPKPKRLRKFQLHVFNNGKHAIFVNCDEEIAWLLGLGFQAPTKEVLANITAKLAVGNPGKPVCVKKNKKG